ncbi:hypothetical protein BU24DRAFT_416061 [Aaosphaeria arxii CBS 175.79]|uniref:Zn(2)-C6 fungal-type domain-containing protein n=1 Tax=Aaosphaeria arxii CBS 175.79 TaxID=1450172 RepID=A0A6A5Y477_9PLEO|nr:uncharacterized protein BU24DRAFT_416061 [Aaosphaeria arxii CBS 175.79]KAF2020352.1 hypothetical protein BU24DRAFT_416061 [Aaosphaeria arxii CBS 175.79]
MAKKRLHTKSRFGCDQCRQRRVKCDEKAPICSMCKQKGHVCIFSRIGPRMRPREDCIHFPRPPHGNICQLTADVSSSVFQGSQSARNYPTPGSTPPQLAISTRSRELELMHRWGARTSVCFSTKRNLHVRDLVARKALQHDYALNALFALASIDIACSSEDVTRRLDYGRSALQYQNRALIGLSNVLCDLSPANCDAITISSILIMVCTMVQPLLRLNQDNNNPEVSDIVLSAAVCVKGISAIIDISDQWLRNGPMHFLLYQRERDLSVPSWTTFPIERLHSINRDECSGEVHGLFEDAICQLKQYIDLDVSVVPWLMTVGQPFRNELQQENSMSLLILMHWGVALETFNNTWWESFAGRRIVEESSTKLLSRGNPWPLPTTWCRQYVGLQG